MERLLDEVSFDAPNRGGQTVRLDGAAVDAKLAELAKQRGPLALHPLARAAAASVQTGSQRTSVLTELAM